MRFQSISKAYGANCIFDGFDLEIETRSILSVVGPSGEGKTTLLQIAAGLVKPDGGSVIKSIER
jgi:ABC-type sugar transport system ATPase subunit